MDGPGLCQADGEAPESAVPPLCGTTRSRRRWQSGNERLLFLSGQACAPVPAQVCPPRQLCWGDLPSLDVHLIGRGAILHLTLAGGACGEEKHKGMRVNGEEDPWGACPASAPGPPGDGFMLALSLATPRPTPSSHQPSVPFLVVFAWSHFTGFKLIPSRGDPSLLPLEWRLQLPLLQLPPCPQSPNLELQSPHFPRSRSNLELPTQWVHFIPPCEQGSDLPAGRVRVGISARAPPHGGMLSCLHPGAWRCGEGR